MLRIFIALCYMFCGYAFGAVMPENTRTLPLPGTVALTFDDGPSPVDTPKILTILKQHHVKATFFVLGPAAQKYPELLKQIMTDGHSIGLHSMTHPDLTTLSPDKLHYEVIENKKVVQSITGTTPLCFRPPYGAINDQVEQYIKSQNLNTILLGLNSFDFDRPGAEKIAAWVLKKVKPGTLILLHDGSNNREQTIAALPIIIAGIQKKGIGFSTICQIVNSQQKKE